MAAVVECGSCGTALRDNARFCDACGAAVAVDTAQYKHVTVLFADVVRSMSIAATVETERLREIMSELVERSAAVVQKYSGTVEFTGDGVMAVFGAPIALEDHAFRGCLAALAIQEEAHRLAAEVQRRDGVALQLRVGLNSGQVIAGEFGSGALRYATIGEQVGFAQRMESVAPPGGVMLSEATARLVEDVAVLAEPEQVHIKNTQMPVRVRRLVAIKPLDGTPRRPETGLVGRNREKALLADVLARSIDGHGGVVTVIGPPGIGKSRAAREAAALAADSDVDVFWTFCESHTANIPFGVVTRLLRTATRVAGLDGAAARSHIREQLRDADPQDLLLLDDLLGIRDPDIAPPVVDPDVRRRRLTALITAALLARTAPVLYVIEDAQWIDAFSESLLADFLSVIGQAPAMVVVTARPEYHGELRQMSGVNTITLAPLSDSETTALLREMLGADSTVDELTTMIAERAAGNPFFAGEMVRELVQRGVLRGERGHYVRDADIAEVSVPATVLATIAARIDRLSVAAKRTLHAAAVIGVRFEADLLTALDVDPSLDELIGVELIDPVRLTPTAEYAFCHPLIRAVAYESQLKADRAQSHRRLADAIEQRDPNAAEQNAALIAEHLQTAGELQAAYGWHMRAAAWAGTRDLGAARFSWEQARRIADRLPADGAEQLAQRIAPRTMLCATDWQAIRESRGHFEELRTLCEAAGDKISLAIGLTGLTTELMYAGRSREASPLVAEQMALLESVGDPTLTVGLSLVPFCIWFDIAEFGELLRWTETVVDLAAGDPAMGAGFGFGSPLASALVWRGVGRWWTGHPQWRQDLRDAVVIAEKSDPTTYAGIVTWAYGGIQHGVLRADDAAVRAIENARHAAAGANNVPVAVITYTLGAALLSREGVADRDRGMEIMRLVRDMFLDEPAPFLVPVADIWMAQEQARRGDSAAAIPVLRAAMQELQQAGRYFYGVWAIGALVEALLNRAAEGDLAEAQQTCDLLAALRIDGESAIVDVIALRLRVLLARARGDESEYRTLLGRYSAMAKALDFEGHMDWAEALRRAGR